MKGRNIVGFALAGLFLFSPPAALGAVRFVASSIQFGTFPVPPYTSSITAADRIQDALDLSGPGDTIYVAGVTTEDYLSSGYVYPESLLVPAGTVLLAGWDCNAALAGYPGSNQRQTDAESLWTVVNVEPFGEAIAVRFAYDSSMVFDTTDVGGTPAVDTSWAYSGPDSNTVFSGFVVRGANNTHGDGGGILIPHGSPTIVRCILDNNKSTGRGAAIFIGSGSPRIAHNTLALSLSGSGGGAIHIAGGSPIIVDNIVYSTADGFGIACSDSADSPLISHNVFYENAGSDIAGCNPDTINYFDVNPVFCDILIGDYRIFEESSLPGLASDGTIPGAWGVGCEAGTKYVSADGGSLFPYNTEEGAATSLASVLAIASAGDTIRISEGQYAENAEVVPGVVLEGGWDANFSTPPWGKVSQNVAFGTVIRPADTDRPALAFSSGASETTVVSFLVLTGAVRGDGALLRADSGRVEISHLSILANESQEVVGSLVLATGAADVVVRYAMIALNEGLPVFDCGEDASLLVEKSNFYQNDLDFAPGCAPAVIDTTHDFPYFCDPAAGDFRLFEEGGFGEAAPGGTPIGALSIGCYFPAHYVNPDSGTGVFPYETPTSATSDLEAVLDLADRGDTIRITAGKFATNLVLDGGEYLEGGWTDGSFTERDPFRSPTVLSGTLPGEPTVRFAGRFPFASTAGGLNGFVITHEPGVEGPGIVAGQGSRPVIHDCVVRDNRVDFAEAPSYPAAGIVMKGANADTQAVSNVFNNTVVNNELVGATIASAAAGGVYMQFAGFSGTDFSRFQRNIVAFNDGGRGGLVLNEDNRLITENFTFGNRNADGQAADLIVMAGFPPAARDSNQTADPMFCDPDAGEWALSTCTPAVNSATGDTVMGALPISEDCVCPNEVFLVNPLASEPGFPFRARRNAARLLSALEPYLSAGDTVKAATGAIIDEFELTGGVVYKGGYNVSTFAEATRGQGTTRIGGNSAHRVMFGGDGVDASTVVDGFTIAAGRADSGGAVLLRGDASPVFSNNRFIESRGNRAGGVLLALDESSPTIIGNLIYGNSVDDEGGIIQLEGAGGLVGQNTITDNGGGGFAIYVRDCDPEIYNNNLAYNSRGLFAAGDPATLAGIVFDHNNVFRHDLDYAPEFLAAVDTTGQGNISENPLYCGRGRRLYTLFDHSPLLGAGRGGGLIGSLYVGCSTPAHYVSSAGSDAYPYITPATAARRIQDALDVAAEAGRWSPADSTDEVRVAGGVYVDTIRVPTNVRLLGGYSPDFAARDAEDHETVIDGGGLGTVVVVDSGVVNNSFVKTSVDGFTITGGEGNHGGGVRVGMDGNPALRNNTIRDCTATLGGGIYIEEGARPTIEGNLVVRDTADAGSGIFVLGVDGATAQASLTRNTFAFNHSRFDTAGTIHISGAKPVFELSIVANSTGGRGFFHEGSLAPTVRNNLFWANAGGDSLQAHIAPSGVHLIAPPEFCDPANDDYGVLFDLPNIQAGQSAVRDPCAVIVWGSEGVGCTRPGHRFLVFEDPNDLRSPVFPYVCATNSARRLSDVLPFVNAGDTVDVAGAPLPAGAHYVGNYELTRGIALRGGFDAGFELPAPRPDSANLLAILEPASLGPILSIRQESGAAGDPSLVIDSTTLVSGFTFRNGNAELVNGGAIRCTGGASPTIRECVFEGNRTKNWGGAISMENAASPRIYDNYFYRNEAGVGGGIYFYQTSDPVVRRNIFSENSASIYGGVRFDQTTGGGSVSNNVFYRNAAGGISLSEPEGEFEIRNNVVASNGAQGISLAPYFEGARTPVLSYNDVWANSGGNYLNLEEGEGDIHSNPGFCNTTDRMATSGTLKVRSDFFRYQECSPLLFAGSDPESPLDAHIGVAMLGDPTCADTTAPDLVIGFLMHSTIPNVANIYIVPTEPIARDSILLRLMYADRGLDSVVIGEDTIEVVVYRFDSTDVELETSDSELSIYRSGNIELRTADTLIVEARAVDLCGQAGVASRAFSSMQFSRATAGKMRSVDRRLTLDVPAGSLAGDGTILIEAGAGAPSANGDPPLAGPYGLILSQVRPISPLAVTVSLSGLDLEDEARMESALYRREGDQWVRVESFLDPERDEVLASVLESGTYAVFRSPGMRTETVPPRVFALHGNQPNPFNPTTRIAFDLSDRGRVSLRVFDVSGREVRNLKESVLPAGRYEVLWDGTDNKGRSVASGIYFYRLTAGTNEATRKMTLVR